MKVSIIIPVYNVEPYINRCITSVLEQTYKDIEIIVIDDCSPDKSMDIVKALMSSHKDGEKLILKKHERNGGLSAARNTGIKEATGDYIYFLDSDDELPLDSISNLIKVAELTTPDFVYGGMLATGTKETFPVKITESVLIGDEILEKYLLHEWYVMGCNKLLNRNFIIDNNLYFIEGILHEDITWSFNLALTAKKMGICNKETYIYHIRNNSISTTVNERNVNDLIFSLKYITTKIENINPLRCKWSFYKYLMSTKIHVLKYAINYPYRKWRQNYLIVKRVMPNNIEVSNIIFKKEATLKTKVIHIITYNMPPSFLFTLLKLRN